MLDWIKALFMKEIPQVEFVPFTKLFTEGLLTKLYTEFEKHINNPVKGSSFKDKINTDILIGTEWENTIKLITNQGYEFTREELVSYLETNCYGVWFAEQSKAGHVFTHDEKCALAGFGFFQDCSDDEGYPFVNYDEQTAEIKNNTHPEFIDGAFKANLRCAIADHERFLQEGC